MGSARYDIILTGRLLENADRDRAVQRLAALFKMDPAKAARLLTGKPHRVKRGADEATARKFRDALLKVGVQVVAKKVVAENVPSRAEASGAPASGAGSLALAPEGTPVLKDSERVEVPTPEIDTSALSLAGLEPWEGAGTPEPLPVAAPDFGLAEPGADIETLRQERAALDPDTSALALDEPGALLGMPRSEAPPPPDTSHIKLEKHNPFL